MEGWQLSFGRTDAGNKPGIPSLSGICKATSHPNSQVFTCPDKTSTIPPWFLTHNLGDKRLPGDSTLQLGLPFLLDAAHSPSPAPSAAPRRSRASCEPIAPSPGSRRTAATRTRQKGWEYLEQNEARAAMRWREGGWARDRTYGQKRQEMGMMVRETGCRKPLLPSHLLAGGRAALPGWLHWCS